MRSLKKTSQFYNIQFFSNITDFLLIFFLLLVLQLLSTDIWCDFSFVEADLFNEVPEVSWDDLSNLTMYQVGDFYEIRVVDTNQLLAMIGYDVWQGNAEIYPVDPTIQSLDTSKRVGHYWSQFLMIAQDWLSDPALSSGEYLISFDMIKDSTKLIEYEGSWGFNDQDDFVTTIFETTAHHWVWVEGNYHYHRVVVSMDVLEDIPDARAVWTELMNDAGGTPTADHYHYLASKTKDDGIIIRDVLGWTNTHHLMEYRLDRGGWLANYSPIDSQIGTVARIVLDSSSSVESPHYVTPIWADFEVIDNVELHVFRSSPGITLPAGTQFYLDNLLITSPVLDNYDWIDPALARAKEFMALFEPSGSQGWEFY